MPKGSEVTQALLTEKVVAQIYKMRLRGIGCAEVADTLGFSHAVIKDAYQGRSWKHCLGVNGNPTLQELRSVRAKPENVTLDAAKVAEIRKALACGEMGISIAARFGVHKATISDIKLGKIWRDA